MPYIPVRCKSLHFLVTALLVASHVSGHAICHEAARLIC